MKAELIRRANDTTTLLEALQRNESILISAPSGEFFVEPPTQSATHVLRSANPFVNSLAAAAIALAPAGAYTGARPIYEYHRVVSSHVGTFRKEFERWYGDADEYLDPVPALISNADVEDLKALLAIPYTGDQRR